MNDKEKFELARELIRHEDTLVNFRMTWLLVLQGFLFGAFVGGVGLFEKEPAVARLYLSLGLAVVSFLGVASCLVARNLIHNAFTQTSAVSKWWKGQDAPEACFPPLTGDFPPGCFYYLFSAGRLPYLLIVAWCLLVALLFVGAVVVGCSAA